MQTMTLAEAEVMVVNTLKEAMEAAINNKNIELAKVTSAGYHVSLQPPVTPII